MREIESLLSAFKDLTDKCLIKSDKSECSIVLGPDLSRALNKSPEHCWSFLDSEVIGTMLNPIISTIDASSSPCLDIDDFDNDVENDDLMLQIS